MQCLAWCKLSCFSKWFSEHLNIHVHNKSDLIFAYCILLFEHFILYWIQKKISPCNHNEQISFFFGVGSKVKIFGWIFMMIFFSSFAKIIEYITYCYPYSIIDNVCQKNINWSFNNLCAKIKTKNSRIDHIQNISH